MTGAVASAVPGASTRRRVEAIYRDSADMLWDRRVKDRIGTAVLAEILDREVVARRPRLVLDLGGGNGFWTAHLETRVRRVLLADMCTALLAEVPSSVASPRVACDATLVPLADGQVDAVVCMGPMYGVGGADEQSRLLTEIRRVLSPGGVAVLEVMTPMGALRNLMLRNPLAAADVQWSEFRSTGKLRGPRFTDFQTGQIYQDPGEAVATVEAHGFDVLDAIGYDAPSSALAQLRHREMTDDVVSAWARLMLDAGKDPAAWGAADQVVIVAGRGEEVPAWRR